MRNHLKFLTIVALVLLAFLVGSWFGGHYRAGSSASVGRKVLYWRDPMHPSYTSDKPGIAPDCGMQLEPVYADDPGGPPERAVSAPPGTIQVSPERQQSMGVRVAMVDKTAPKQTVRELGRVAPDETRTYRINAATDGWVKAIQPVTTGSLVKKDDLLAGIYAPESFSAMKAYLYGLRSMDRFEASGKETKEQLELTDANIENYRNGLRNLGMTEHQLDEIRRTREGANIIEIRAPEAGFIIARNITLGQRFERGEELYRIVDLSHVWILVDVYENDGQFLESAGEAVAVHRGRRFPVRKSSTLPQFDAASRTLKLRFEAENPNFLLRPDMFVDVEFPLSLPPAITVPVDTVIDSGMRKRVFVAHGTGYFEPREVETGWRFGDRVEIAKGLSEGERVVVSGSFLIDSESRMKTAMQGMREPVRDPVCGMDVDAPNARVAGKTSTYKNTTYYFCSDDCKQKFDASPERYARQASSSPSTPHKGNPDDQPHH